MKKTRLLLLALVSWAVWVQSAYAAGPTIKAGGISNNLAAASVRTVTLSELPAATAQDLAGASAVAVRPRVPGYTEAQWNALKNQLRQESLAHGGLTGNTSPQVQRMAMPDTPFSPKTFVGLDASCSFVTPSDMGIAAGGSAVLQVVNSCITVKSKTTGKNLPGYPKSLGQFLACGCFPFDPRLTYDVITGHYILTADASPTIYLAVSATSNPAGLWYVYSFNFDQGTGNFADFPTLGYDREAIYIGINDFINGGGFTNELWVINKAQAESGIPPTWYDWFGICLNTSLGCEQLDSLQPMNLAGPYDQPRAEYVVSSFNGSTAAGVGCGTLSAPCNALMVLSFSGTWTTPTFSGAVVGTPATYAYPTAADEAFCAGCVDTGDMRVTGNVQYMGGSLYPTLTTSIGGAENTTLTFEVHPFVNTAANAQIIGAAIPNAMEYGDFGGVGTNGSAYYGTVQPNTDGDLTMVFAYSDDNSYPGVAYISHRTSTPYFTWNSLADSGFYLKAGQVYYNEGRWGDYSGTAIEYNSKTHQVNTWFSGMFSSNVPGITNSWSTAIGYNAFSDPTQP